MTRDWFAQGEQDGEIALFTAFPTKPRMPDSPYIQWYRVGDVPFEWRPPVANHHL